MNIYLLWTLELDSENGFTLKLLIIIGAQALNPLADHVSYLAALYPQVPKLVTPTLGLEISPLLVHDASQ